MIGRLRAGSVPAPVEEAMRMRGVWNVDRAQAALNVFGGAAFAAGSLLFLNSALERLGVALFVAGSFGMLVGALAVWNERYAPRRHRPTQAALDVAPVVAPVVARVAAPVAATVTVPVATRAPASVTSPAAPDTRPATPPGD